MKKQCFSVLKRFRVIGITEGTNVDDVTLSSDRSWVKPFSIKRWYGGRFWYLALVERAVQDSAKLFGGAKLTIFVGPSKRGVVSFN